MLHGTRDGRTRVEALGNFRDGAFLSAVTGGTAGFVGASLAVKALGGFGALGLLGPVGMAVGLLVPAYLLYRRLFAREDAALREAVTRVTAQVEATSADREAPVKPTDRDEE